MNFITPKLQDMILGWKLDGLPNEKAYEYAISLVQIEIRRAQDEAQKVIDASKRITE